MNSELNNSELYLSVSDIQISESPDNSHSEQKSNELDLSL